MLKMKIKIYKKIIRNMDCKYSNQIKTFNHLKDNKCLNSLVNNVYINVAGCLIFI